MHMRLASRPTNPPQSHVAKHEPQDVRSGHSPGAIQALAHDLRGPLANLSLLIERLSELADPAARATAEACVAKADRLIARVDNLLREAIHNDAEGPLPAQIRQASVSLSEIVDTVVVANLPLAEDRNVALSTDIQRDVCLQADPSLLARALENLVTNAIKLSRPAGQILIEVCRLEGRAALKVHDHGPGFTPDDLAHIFQPFTLLSARDARRTPSHGLGLWIAQSIVGQHGGTLLAANKADGTGATLTIELPLVHH